MADEKMPLWCCQRCGYMVEECACLQGYQHPDCLDGHQWHDTATGRVCAACLAEAPAEPITPEAADDPKRDPRDAEIALARFLLPTFPLPGDAEDPRGTDYSWNERMQARVAFEVVWLLLILPFAALLWWIYPPAAAGFLGAWLYDALAASYREWLIA